MTWTAPVIAGCKPHTKPNVPAVVNETLPAASGLEMGFGLSPPEASSGCCTKSPVKVTS